MRQGKSGHCRYLLHTSIQYSTVQSWVLYGTAVYVGQMMMTSWLQSGGYATEPGLQRRLDTTASAAYISIQDADLLRLQGNQGRVKQGSPEGVPKQSISTVFKFG